MRKLKLSRIALFLVFTMVFLVSTGGMNTRVYAADNDAVIEQDVESVNAIEEETIKNEDEAVVGEDKEAPQGEKEETSVEDDKEISTEQKEEAVVKEGEETQLEEKEKDIVEEDKEAPQGEKEETSVEDDKEIPTGQKEEAIVEDGKGTQLEEKEEDIVEEDKEASLEEKETLPVLKGEESTNSPKLEVSENELEQPEKQSDEQLLESKSILPKYYIRFKEDNLSLEQGNKLKLEVESNWWGAIEWSSSNTDVVSVKRNWKNHKEAEVTAVGVGEATITVTTISIPQKTATCTVTVKSTSVKGISLNKKQLNLKIGDTETLDAAIEPENASNKQVIWSSEPKGQDVMDVDQNGRVTAKNEGTATVVVTTRDGGYKSECEVKVERRPVEGVKIKQGNEITLEPKESKQLIAKITPNNATNKNVTWSSDKPDIAEVLQNGTVTAGNPGIAIITVTTEDGKYEDSCKVTVDPGVFGAVTPIVEKVDYDYEAEEYTAYWGYNNTYCWEDGVPLDKGEDNWKSTLNGTIENMTDNTVPIGEDSVQKHTFKKGENHNQFQTKFTGESVTWRIIHNNGCCDSQDISATAYAKDAPVVVTGVDKIPDVTVNSIDIISSSLPVSVRVTFNNREPAEVNVEWNNGEQLPDDGSGLQVYKFTGSISNLPYEATNPGNLKASVNVIVQKKSVVDVEEFGDITVPYGTKQEEIVLPKEATISLSDNSNMKVPIKEWTSTPVYECNKPGDYNFQGELDLTTLEYTEESNVKVNVRVSTPPVRIKGSTEGRGTVDVQGAIGGATLKLYNTVGEVKSNKLDESKTEYQFTEVPITNGYYVTQIVNEIESEPSNSVNVTFGKFDILNKVTDNRDGTYTAVWGYTNNNTEKIIVAEGESIFSSGADTIIEGNKNPINVFEVGTHDSAFTTKFYRDDLIWTLTCPDGEKKSLIAEAGPEAEISKVGIIKDINVEYGTKLNDIEFPSTVKCALIIGNVPNNEGIDVEVNWEYDKTSYDGNKSGKYEFKGELVLPKGVTNTDKLQAEVNVIVDSKPYTPPYIPPTPSNPDKTPPVITLEQGTEIVELEIGGGKYDVKSNVTASDIKDGDITNSIKVTGTVDTSKVGEYTLKYNVKDKAGNAAEEVTRTVKVVNLVKGVNVIKDVFVPYGTSKDKIALPEKIQITLSDGSKSEVPVIWNEGKPLYNPNVSTEYIFTGVIDSSKLQYVKATSLKAEAKVIVEKRKVISVAELKNINVSYGMEQKDIGLPKIVGIKLSDDSNKIVSVPVIWDKSIPQYDGKIAKKYAFEGTLDLSVLKYVEETKLKAKVNVIVAPYEANGTSHKSHKSHSSSNTSDTAKPVITLIGDSKVILAFGTDYKDAGATAEDNKDGDITNKIKIGGDKVDTNKAGTYVITYNVSDSEGNKANEVRRTVVVEEEVIIPVEPEIPEGTPDKKKPVITLNGDTEITLNLGDKYEELGAVAVDDVDGDITDKIEIRVNGKDEKVNTDKEGTYVITYNVSDNAGNKADEILRTVVVKSAEEGEKDIVVPSDNVPEGTPNGAVKETAEVEVKGKEELPALPKTGGQSPLINYITGAFMVLIGLKIRKNTKEDDNE
ncbi:immunoglobulin-like domain-containing protein [Clostridium sp. ZS2-4]|uniref:immunoglobulin-like domain-containing protein n=1 Tax=Clostridium sp. ZS2-4 TaxID=2987703 RepID=UPI00227B6C1A|nr:immunoglobulin-like domain-containing protein [Clostridium sp. ZS2-4]MCY6354598.1 DUF5011 domain-containing protein [Clostridium sp. ZS2-4]